MTKPRKRFILYKQFADELITVKGYNAKSLLDANLAVNPYAAYNMMRQLITDPDALLQGIRMGFRVK